MTSSLLSIYPNPTIFFKISANLSKDFWCSHYYILHAFNFWLTMFNLSPVHVCLRFTNFCIHIFIYTTTRFQQSVLKVRSLVLLWDFLSTGQLGVHGICTLDTDWLTGFPNTTFHMKKKETFSARQLGCFSTWVKASVWNLYFLLY